jgi:hypothetical protein
VYLLVSYGNHVRGAKFIDASNLIDEQLTRTIDLVCQQVNGFFSEDWISAINRRRN